LLVRSFLCTIRFYEVKLFEADAVELWLRVLHRT
jgi:hypothetical protein